MVSMLGPSYITEDNICIPQYANVEENLSRLAKYERRDGDYLLCSYPKSGTHWVNEILRMLVTGVAQYTSDPIHNLESGNYRDLASCDATSPRVLQTHLPHDMLPQSITSGKILYVMRDPRDQIVSLYHHHQGLKWSRTMEFPEFFRNVMDNPHKVEYGHWFRNPYQWWQNFRYSKTVLFVFYEDLIQDLHYQIQRIVEFYDLKHVTPSFISEVTLKTKFSEMKFNKPVGDWFTQWHKDTFSIYRRGIIGNWQPYFNHELCAAFKAFCNANMAKGCDYPMRYRLQIDYLPGTSIHPDRQQEESVRQQEVAMAH